MHNHIHSLRLIMGGALLIALSACGVKGETHVSADGKTTAHVSADGQEWTFEGPDGQALVKDYDSITVVERHENGQPKTFYYSKGREKHYFQYYENLTLRSRGMLVDGQREGKWEFFHPNGLPQCEATYLNGKEEGLYTVYRDNGVPYYRGHYEHGKRVGTWEAYDTEGNLADSKQY